MSTPVLESTQQPSQQQTPASSQKPEIVVKSVSDFKARFGEHPVGTSLYTFFYVSMIISIVVGMYYLKYNQINGVYRNLIFYSI